MSHARPYADEEWERMQRELIASFNARVARARAAERADLEAS
jgi:hypothetical protein